MTVTEFALLPLRGGHDDLELLEVVMQSQEVQDRWVREHQPQTLDHAGNLSTMCIQKSKTPYLLITAPWESPGAHAEWIQSSDNQAIMANLSAYILPPGEGAVELFHMDPAGRNARLPGGFPSHGDFNVCHISVDAGQRRALEEKYRAVEDQLLGVESDSEAKLWAGWKIEKPDGKETLAVFWGEDVPDERLREMMSSYADVDLRHFRHFVR